MKKAMLKRLGTAALAGVLACSTVMGVSDNASAAKKKETKKQVDLDGTYHASLGVQTCTNLWITRLAYYEESQNKYYNTDNYAYMLSESAGENQPYDGTFTDVEIAGNGIYTVKLEGADFAGETTISQLHVATDIPVNDTIHFTNVTAKVNGKEFFTFEEGFMEDEELYLQGGMDLIVINHWREALVKMLKEQGRTEDGSGYNLLMGTGNESIEVTFTVSGFNYDNEQATGESKEDTEEAEKETAVKTDSKKESEESHSVMPYAAAVIIIAAVAVCCISINRKKKK